MLKAIEFHPNAAQEAVSAQNWYYDLDSNLGIEFRTEVDRTLARIAAAPDRWPRHLHGTRCLLLARFPFLIVYTQTELQLQIIAVQHTKRRPGYWRSRVE